MSTFPNILPTVGANPLENEPDARNFSGSPQGPAGLFEKVMARALSPSAEEGVIPNEKSQPPQIPPQNSPWNNAKAAPNLTIIGNTLTQSKNAPPSSQTSVKSPAKPANENSGKDKNVRADATAVNAPINPEVIANQIPAAAVFTLDTIARPGMEMTLAATSAPAPTGTAIKSATVPVTLPQTKQIPAGATKISDSDLSENRTTPPAAQALASQQTGSFTANEAGLKAKNPGISMPVDSMSIDSLKAKPSVETDSPSSRTTDSNIGTSATGTQAQDVSHGTSIAKQDVVMKQAEKTNKIAGQAEKVLPGGAVSGVRGTLSSFSPHSEQLTTTVTASAPTSNNVSQSASLPVDSSAGITASPPNTRTLERAQDMVTQSAMRLSDSGNNSLQVVIKPDAGTQLSLELRQQGGGIEVQAVLQQGNFNHLSQQWPDLQQRLDQHGIRLAPLTDNATSGNNSNEAFQQKQNQTTNSGPGLALVEMPAGMFTPEIAQTSAHRGWETWA